MYLNVRCARVINDLIAGRAADVPEGEDHACCPTCGAPLAERGAHCMACLPRMRIFMRLARMLAPYRWQVALIMAATLLTVATQVIPPYLTKMIVDHVLTGGRHGQLTLWIGAMVACGVVRLAARIVSGGTTNRLAARFTADLRSKVHAILQRLHMSYCDKHESGELAGRVMHDTREIEAFLLDDGKLAESGTRDELVVRDGIYAKLVTLQTDISRLRAEVWHE